MLKIINFLFQMSLRLKCIVLNLAALIFHNLQFLHHGFMDFTISGLQQMGMGEIAITKGKKHCHNSGLTCVYNVGVLKY